MRTEHAGGQDRSATLTIDEFRAKVPAPTQQQWMALIEAHPEFAAEIADAALIDQTTQHLEAADLVTPLDEEVFDAGVSQAINRLYEIPSVALCEAQAKIAAVLGPDVRVLAREAGLGAAASALLSGVLVGSIEAPRQIVEFLTRKWDSTPMVLTECFRHTAAAAMVPAFKAETGKPSLSAQPVSWAEAVKSLNLSEQETQRLLQLQD